MSNRWKIISGIIISLAFLVYALSKVNYAEMAEAFSQADYFWTIPMMATVIVGMFIRAARWHWLIRPFKRLPFSSVFSSIMIGFMANNILPARVGEVVRAVSLSHKHSLSKSAVLATVVTERVFDSLGLLIVFFSTLIIVDIPADLKKASVVALAMTMVLLFFLYLLKARTDLAVRIICAPIGKFSESLSSRASVVLTKFAEGLSILTEPVSVLITILYSVLLWAFSGFAGYLIFLAFGLYPQVWAALMILFVTVLAVSLPSSPGYIGTFHAACVIGFQISGSLGMFGQQEVSNSVALSYSVILWSCQYFPVTLLGLYYLKREHLNFSEISKEKVINETGE